MSVFYTTADINSREGKGVQGFLAQRGFVSSTDSSDKTPFFTIAAMLLWDHCLPTKEAAIT